MLIGRSRRSRITVRMVSDALFLVAFFLTVLGFFILPILDTLKKYCRRRCLHQNLSLLRGFHAVLLFVLSFLAFPWMKLEGPYFTPSKWDHYFVLLGTWCFNVLRLLQINEELLEDKELERQRTNLDFQTLQDATCSNPRDEARIRQTIAGREADVETAIRILMKAGAYDDDLRKAFESGLNISGMGTTDLILKTGVPWRSNQAKSSVDRPSGPKVAFMLWLLCASHCFAIFILQEHEKGCFRESTLAMLQGQVSVSLCFAVAILVPISAFLLERRGPERGVFAARVWSLGM